MAFFFGQLEVFYGLDKGNQISAKRYSNSNYTTGLLWLWPIIKNISKTDWYFMVFPVTGECVKNTQLRMLNGEWVIRSLTWILFGESAFAVHARVAGERVKNWNLRCATPLAPLTPLTPVMVHKPLWTWVSKGYCGDCGMIGAPFAIAIKYF